MISLFIGMFLATVGMDDIYGRRRFTFGSRIMETGINFTTVLIGLFAIGEVLDQLSVKNKGEGEVIRTAPQDDPSPPSRKSGGCATPSCAGWESARSSGRFPAPGRRSPPLSATAWKNRFPRHPEKFGTGVWEGLAASETSINASTGGAMIPLLTLGIPGSGATAVMMGAFLLHGIQPGPLLFSKSPEAVYTIFVGMLVCNLIMILAGLITAKFFSELMRVPENILSAFIISFCLLGAFALRNDMADVWFMAIFGIVGIFHAPL